MEPKAHKLEQSGFELWGVSVGTKLVGSYWTENAARTRIAELVKGAATASNGGATGVQDAPQTVPRMSATVDATTLLESILGDMRAHNNAPFPAVSVDYESWKAKSSISKLLDSDRNEEWEAQEAAERDAEAAYWAKLVWERRAGKEQVK